MSPDVSIIIVSYNTRQMTLDCLASIARETRASHEVIVVDNNSSDGSADAIAAHAPWASLIRRSDNLGFARANNLAAERARGRFMLLLNPDTVILDHAIDRLLAFADRRPDAMIWGGRTNFADGSLNATNCFRAPSAWSLFCRATGLAAAFPHNPVLNSEEYGGWTRDRERAVDIVTGCFLLIETATWRTLGGFDPAFYMYGEEVDLCLRARRIGAAPRVTPDATIIHHGGASEITRANKMVKVLTAKSTLIRRHWPAVMKPVGLALLAAWPAGRALAIAAQRAIVGGSGATTEWGEVWQRRSEWLGGYRPAEPPMLATADGRLG
ncbi:MAG: glycosyltransferase family 2 protein [Hyphomicrobiales bacterium]|nr:glycosyltransferase family 2 protein [Hyphomicrobiales bacterium]